MPLSQSEKSHLKTQIINANTILKISEVLNELPCLRVKFGAGSSSVTKHAKVNKKIYERLDKGIVTSVINTDFNCLFFKKTGRKRITSSTVIYVLAEDRSVTEYQINTFASVDMIINDYDIQLMKVCSLYAQGIIEDNDIRDGIGGKIEIPLDIERTDVINRHVYEGYVTSTGNLIDVIATGESNRKDYYRFVEDSVDQEIYDTADILKMEDEPDVAGMYIPVEENK